MKVLINIACLILALNCLNRTLVVLDNKQLLETHSDFFDKLKNFGEVEFAYSFNKEIKLKYYDQYIHDQLVVFCTSEKQQESGLKVSDIIGFYDSGRNVIIAGDIDISRSYRKAFYAFGVEPDQTGHQLKDHFSNFGDSKTIVTQNTQQVYPFITEPLKTGKILYRGLGLKLVNYVNNQLFALVRGEPTTYSQLTTTKTATRAGSQIALVATVQGLNSARAVLTGSLDFFSNQFTRNTNFDNSVYIDNLLRWVNKRSGLLRTSNIKYHSVGESENQIVFTVTQKLHYQIDVQEFNYKTNSWQPYVANDLAVEFVMLDPWVIQRLSNIKNTKTYYANFYTPTKEGIYQFKFIYERPGFNFIADKNRVTLRPPKHDEFERFILTALPYYTGTFATIFGTFIFIVFFLYSRFSKEKQE